MYLFLHYPRCSTCRAAKGWLDKHGIEYTERNLIDDNPTAAELRKWHKGSKLSLKSFFNVNGVLYREKKIKDKIKVLSEDELLDLLATDGKMVKRPLLIAPDGKVLTGFKESEYKALFPKRRIVEQNEPSNTDIA